MAALADISELTTLQNERGCRLGDQCGEEFGRQLVDSAAHDFHRGGEPKMKKHMTRLCDRLVGVSCCKPQLARTEGAANVVRYGLVVLSFTFLLPASAQDRSNRIFDQFTGRYHCGGRWTEFQFKIVPVTGPLGIGRTRRRRHRGIHIPFPSLAHEYGRRRLQPGGTLRREDRPLPSRSESRGSLPTPPLSRRSGSKGRSMRRPEK